MNPILENALSGCRSVAEATHPVVIKTLWFTAFQFPQKCPPESCLPGRQFISIGTTHTSSTDHPPQPGARGQQKCGRPSTRCLKGCGDTTGSTTPNQHIHCVDVEGHGENQDAIRKGRMEPARLTRPLDRRFQWQSRRWAGKGVVKIPPLSKGPQENAEAMTYSLTTPLYYVNAKPHLGSTYTTIACDALARFQRLEGNSVVFITGVDEHGQKIQRTAESQHISPQDHCDLISSQYSQLWTEWGISNDRFVRTTSDRHLPLVQEFFCLLYTSDAADE